VLLRDWPAHFRPPEIIYVGGFVGLGGACSVLVGHFCFRIGLWKLKVWWVIGADQMQCIQGARRVLVSIPYTNLAAVELCKRGKLDPPFLGLRLVYPQFLKDFAGGTPLTPNGYHLIITAAESATPLPVVFERIQSRLLQWRAGASASPTSGPGPNPVTDITSSPDLQEDFAKKPL
jgi:hypothetical protein